MMHQHTGGRPVVNKEPVPAELFLSDGTAFVGSVYLRLERELEGVHPVEDLLSGTDRLIPCRGEAGELVLVGRAAIAAVRLAHHGKVPANLTEDLPMRVTVAGGHRFEGILVVPRGTEDRISDLLNQAGAWLLQLDGNREVWIAADRLIRTEAP